MKKISSELNISGDPFNEAKTTMAG